MKKILLLLCLTLSVGIVNAGGNGRGGHGGGSHYSAGSYRGGSHYHGGHRGNYWNNGGWIAPAIIGGVVLGAVVASPYVYNPPVVVEQPPVYTNSTQSTPVCQYPFVPTYKRIYTTDRYNNNIQVDQFVGCQ